MPNCNTNSMRSSRVGGGAHRADWRQKSGEGRGIVSPIVERIPMFPVVCQGLSFDVQSAWTQNQLNYYYSFPS